MSTRVLLLCGGMSGEHEVSLASARSVLEAARDLNVVPLVIGRDGALLSSGESRALLGLPPADSTESPVGQLGELAESGEADGPADLPAAHRGALTLARAVSEADVVFPLLHGPFGEDGRVQGMLDMLGLPYVGAGVFGSSVAMDKLGMKAVFAAHDLPQVRYVPVTRHRWRKAPAEVTEEVEGLQLPLFVKPANLGSSIGISRVDEPAQLAPALDEAFEHDRRVVVEEGVVGARELEIGVLGNDEPELSVVGEIRYGSEFYDYATKYTDGEAQLLVPADVPPQVVERLRAIAKRAFAAVDAAGMARVDFFYQPETGQVLLNEINTIPGFTRHSMYPLLWQASGVSYPQLIRRLVALALEQR